MAHTHSYDVTLHLWPTIYAQHTSLNLHPTLELLSRQWVSHHLLLSATNCHTLFVFNVWSTGLNPPSSGPCSQYSRAYHHIAALEWTWKHVGNTTSNWWNFHSNGSDCYLWKLFFTLYRDRSSFWWKSSQPVDYTWHLFVVSTSKLHWVFGVCRRYASYLGEHFTFFIECNCFGSVFRPEDGCGGVDSCESNVWPRICGVPEKGKTDDTWGVLAKFEGNWKSKSVITMIKQLNISIWNH